MGTSTLKSANITNRDATPKVASNSRAYGNDLQSSVGFVTAAAADDTSSIYRVCPVPSNCCVRGVYLYSVAQGGSAAVDIGAYRDTSAGGAVVSAAFFGSAVSVVSVVQRSDVTNESTSYTGAKREQPLWQALGLSADPGGEIDISISVQATLTNGGVIGLEVQYVM